MPGKKAKSKTRKGKEDKISFEKIIVFWIIAVMLSFFVDNIISQNIESMRNPVFNDFFTIITYLGNLWIIIVIGIILTLLLANQRKTRYILPLWFTIVITSVLVFFIKDIINRARPFEVLNVIPLMNAPTASFPSGHAALVFCLLPFLIKFYEKLKWLFVTLAILVSFSRIYLGVHYLSDVVFGSLLGLVIGTLFLYIGEKYSALRGKGHEKKA